MFSRQEDAAGPCAGEKHTQVLGEARAPCSPASAKSMDPLHGHENSFKCNAIFKDCFLGNRKWRRRMITRQKSLTFHLNNSALHSILLRGCLSPSLLPLVPTRPLLSPHHPSAPHPPALPLDLMIVCRGEHGGFSKAFPEAFFQSSDPLRNHRFVISTAVS